MFSYDMLFHLATYGDDLSISQPPPALGITIPLSVIYPGSQQVSPHFSCFSFFPVPSPSTRCAWHLLLLSWFSKLTGPHLKGEQLPHRRALPGKFYFLFIAYLLIFQNSTNQGYVHLTNFSKGLNIRNKMLREKRFNICHQLCLLSPSWDGEGLYSS